MTYYKLLGFIFSKLVFSNIEIIIFRFVLVIPMFFSYYIYIKKSNKNLGHRKTLLQRTNLHEGLIFNYNFINL